MLVHGLCRLCQNMTQAETWSTLGNLEEKNYYKNKPTYTFKITGSVKEQWLGIDTSNQCNKNS